MKRIVLIALTLLLLLCSVACGAGDEIGSSGNQARSASDFVAAFREEGYTTEDITSGMAADVKKWIEGETSVAAHGFYRLKISEEAGWFIFITFSSTDVAKDAFDDIVNMYSGDSRYLEKASGKNGEKAFYRDSLDSEFGGAIYVSQVEDSVLLLTTEWDVDREGKYENTPAMILEKLGY